MGLRPVRRRRTLRTCIGEIGFVLMMLTGCGVGMHFAMFVLFDVSLTALFYWSIPFATGFFMAVAHPDPERWERLPRTSGAFSKF
jgi:hypothetical protein